VRTAAQILGLLVTVVVWVLWIAIATAIPTNIGLLVHLIAILAGPIVGILMYTEVMNE
jgi:hypothetical protein